MASAKPNALKTMKPTNLLLSALLLLTAWAGQAARNNPNTDWLKAAKTGVFMHFLPDGATGLAGVKAFDVDALAGQLSAAGAKYFVLTLGQNSGYFNAPNAVYDRYTGYAPGERCSTRDLPLDLYRALHPKGIRLMLYLPCQVPNRDARAQKAYGLAEGPRDQPLDLDFAKKWAETIQEWADRYGDKVSGWWFDGGYTHVRFNEAIAREYEKAVKHGNPNGIATYNPGVSLIRHTQAEDYTAGELNEPFDFVPQDRWVDGSQWHALTYLGGNWGERGTRIPTEKWTAWARAVAARGGAITLDAGPNWDSQAGPIGAIAPAQAAQIQALCAAARAAADAPARLKRADSFFGIHFDFHAGPDCNAIGQKTTREMVETILNLTHPDYLQIDCKGHRGLTSYPTRAGNPAPGFVGDPLRLWRQVTAERGVALYMHYSGVWDSEAILQHPDWAVINADGSTNANATSFFGPYADRLLIPQLRELAGDYGVDGAWIDGECWAAAPDWGAPALQAFRQATGLQEIPRKPGDPNWREFLQFNREAFRRYLRHYIGEVKKTHPNLQLCSNWAFTDHMPEAVCAPVDFISGDYSPEDSLNSARFSARYLARQGKPWDLMAWSFARPKGAPGAVQKSAPQLQREAAAVLAQGGGFQAYFTQRRDGSVKLEEMPVMAEVAKFCRARQAACHHAAPVPQIALLYSTAAHYRESNGLFPRDLTRLRGTLQALLENQQSVEILSEHNLAGRLAEYPLIVVPETDFLEPDFKGALIAYAQAGGNLLLVGPQTAALFATELGVTLEGPAETRQLKFADHWTAVKGPASRAKLAASARPFGQLHATADENSPAQPAGSLATLGKGRLAATYFSFSQGYLESRPEALRQYLGALARELFPEPIVQVKGSPDVDVAVNRLGGRLAVNLVNTAGPHANIEQPIRDAIPAVGPLEIEIRAAAKPARVTLEPGARKLDFQYAEGKARLTIPRLEIHDIIVVE
jgi:hypothetical protein